MIKETNFQKKIIKWLESYKGVWCVKFHASGMTKVGVPDILCCIKGSFVAIEVKTDKGIVSELQKYNIEYIKRIGGYAYVISPDNFLKITEEIIKKWKLERKSE